jgi:hypothetical protein
VAASFLSIYWSLLLYPSTSTVLYTVVVLVPLGRVHAGTLLALLANSTRTLASESSRVSHQHLQVISFNHGVVDSGFRSHPVVVSWLLNPTVKAAAWNNHDSVVLDPMRHKTVIMWFKGDCYSSTQTP